MLIRLIYASEATEPMGPGTVESLLAHARRKNRLHDLTGLLAFDSRYFLQVLEGDRQLVSDLYGRLVQDPRHKRLVLLQADPIAERNFFNWSMGFVAADAMGRERLLRHSASSRFEPHQMRASAATALLTELGRSTESETAVAA